MNESLYRDEALQARQTRTLGNIILVRPPSLAFLVALSSVFTVLLVLFIIFGKYTSRVVVPGQLIPNSGLMRIYAQQTGTVLQKNFSEGDTVEKGTVLYVLSTTRKSEAQGDTQATISQEIGRRRQFLAEEIQKNARLHADEHLAVMRKVDGLREEQAKIVSQIEGQRSRVKLAEDALARANSLLAQNFISKEQIQGKQSDLLEQMNKLQALDRDLIGVRRELAAQNDESRLAPLRQQSQLAQLQRQQSTLDQELVESEAARRLVIVAPDSGLVTAIMAESGQMVEGGRTLATLVPKGSLLEAHLYAPTSAAGFIKPGAVVRMRYQAFPYQKFGNATGRVISISRTALPKVELETTGSLPLTGGDLSPRYRITVRLDRQEITAYGHKQQLQAGMLLEGDIMQETRWLYEWMLEPLYNLSGKL